MSVKVRTKSGMKFAFQAELDICKRWKNVIEKMQFWFFGVVEVCSLL